jgi:UDP-glucose 4-epimerase
MNSFKDFYKGKKVLITGGLGFVGSNLAHRLVDLGSEVLIVDSMLPDYGANLFNVAAIRDNVTINIADIRDANALPHLVRDQDIIFNVAGQVSHIDSMLDPYTDLEINCRAQLTLLEACRHHNPHVKVVFTGTRQIYGRPMHLPVSERHTKRPTDVNGINKMAGEWYHIVYNDVYGVRACSIRLTNTYGPRQLMKHNRQGFLPWFIRLAISGEEITLFGDGKQIRDVTYIEDVLDALLRAGISNAVNGRVFNLGGTEPVSLLTIAETLVKVTGKCTIRIVPFPPEKKAIDIGDFYADYSAIKSTLAWEPKIGLEDGLTRTVEYYRKYQEHYW